MTRELKTRWLEALRSGQYKKGRFQLHCSDTNAYCCLGVLCELVHQPTQDGSIANGYPQLRPFVDFNTQVQCVKVNDRDTYADDFLKVADYIERSVPVED